MENKEIIEKLFDKRTCSKNIHEAVLLVENSNGDFSIGYAVSIVHSGRSLLCMGFGKIVQGSRVGCVCKTSRKSNVRPAGMWLI